MIHEQQGVEWPLTVAIARLASGPLGLSVKADAKICDDLAVRFGIPKIKVVSAEVLLRQQTGGDVVVTGHLHAEVTQLCVVSLEPVDQVVDFAVDGQFTDRIAEEDQLVDLIYDPADDSDPPELLVDDGVPLGEWLAQHLSLAIDPFPRAPDAALERDDTFDAAAPAGHPFAKLALLRTAKRK